MYPITYRIELQYPDGKQIDGMHANQCYFLEII